MNIDKQTTCSKCRRDIMVVDSDDDWRENITLNASQSHDPDGQIIHYLWYEKMSK